MASTAKKAYKITNWSQYNDALVRRGDVTLWFDQQVLDAWQHENDQPKVGRPFIYSDLAIESLLMLRELFRLPYRQTEGLGRTLIRLLQADVAVPDFTSLAKRAGRAKVAIRYHKPEGPIDVVVDSTGLKVYGEGEWKVRQHGAGKRRTWRKVHLAVNPATHEIVAERLTDNSSHDAAQVEPLLEQVDDALQIVYGDGAYDQWKVYRTLAQRGIVPIVPPRRNARISQHGNSRADPLPRDAYIRQIRRDGRRSWKEEIGYHRRSLAETAMYRLKACFGGTLKNRKFEHQRTEVSLRCKLLNWFVALGMPQFVWN
jgi:hypothetical protein